jgi:hypothetical protein
MYECFCNPQTRIYCLEHEGELRLDAVHELWAKEIEKLANSDSLVDLAEVDGATDWLLAYHREKELNQLRGVDDGIREWPV